MEPQEADEAARLYVRSWQAGYKGLLPQYYLDLLSPERWKDSFEGLPGSFVLTEGGVIAGHSCARPARGRKNARLGRGTHAVRPAGILGQGIRHGSAG